MLIEDTTDETGAPLCPDDGTRCVTAKDGLASWACPVCGIDVLP
jgi:hypothetical protein